LVTEDNATILKVSAGGDANRLAAAISHAIYDGKDVTLRAIGAAAVNQGIKAIAVARGYVASRGHSLSVVPGFTSITMPEGEVVTGLLLRVVVE
jgi:stage V sporulation protein S